VLICGEVNGEVSGEASELLFPPCQLDIELVQGGVPSIGHSRRQALAILVSKAVKPYGKKALLG
jgi:hypothetical protein